MIPWATLLRHAPAILTTADALLARVVADKGPDTTRTLEERLAMLERGSRESAQLLHDVAAQVNALTVAQATAARRARLALGLALVAIAAAIGLIVLSTLS